MTKLTLLNLNGSKDLVEELTLKNSKLVWGGQMTGGETSGGSSDNDEDRRSSDDDRKPSGNQDEFNRCEEADDPKPRECRKYYD